MSEGTRVVPSRHVTGSRVVLAMLILVAASGRAAESTTPAVGPRVILSAEQSPPEAGARPRDGDLNVKLRIVE
ncbi:MAG: hypothetical protein ACRETX_13845 [Steroidobacteraceae bacterium]